MTLEQLADLAQIIGDSPVVDTFTRFGTWE
jgi:hypothetical protein